MKRKDSKEGGESQRSRRRKSNHRDEDGDGSVDEIPESEMSVTEATLLPCANTECPISGIPLSEINGPVYFLETNGVRHGFDAEVMYAYLKQESNMINPLNRTPLTLENLKALDELLGHLGTPQALSLHTIEEYEQRRARVLQDEDNQAFMLSETINLLHINYENLVYAFTRASGDEPQATQLRFMYIHEFVTNTLPVLDSLMREHPHFLRRQVLPQVQQTLAEQRAGLNEIIHHQYPSTDVLISHFESMKPIFTSIQNVLQELHTMRPDQFPPLA